MIPSIKKIFISMPMRRLYNVFMNNEHRGDGHLIQKYFSGSANRNSAVVRVARQGDLGIVGAREAPQNP